MPRHKSWPRVGRTYPRKTKWIERRNAVFERAGNICEVSGEELSTIEHGEDCRCDGRSVGETCKVKWNRAVDHLWPEKYLRAYAAGSDVHCLANLVCITKQLHGRKTKVEWKLFKGDRLAYLQELRYLGFDQVVIDNAWKAICASIKVPF